MVSAAPSPTGRVVDDLYSYGQFGGFWTVGCRLQASRWPICAMYDDTARSVGQGGRVFEISAFQSGEATFTFGGSPFQGRETFWRECGSGQPYTACLDHFRWELTRDTLSLYVNGHLYMQHAGLPANRQLPDTLLNQPVYVYFSSWIYKPTAETTRFHWKRLAEIPSSSPAAAAASRPRRHRCHPLRRHRCNQPRHQPSTQQLPLRRPRRRRRCVRSEYGSAVSSSGCKSRCRSARGSSPGQRPAPALDFAHRAVEHATGPLALAGRLPLKLLNTQFPPAVNGGAGTLSAVAAPLIRVLRLLILAPGRNREP